MRRTTLSEGAYEAIRRKIITGVLAPSSKLVVATLANGARSVGHADQRSAGRAGTRRAGHLFAAPRLFCVVGDARSMSKRSTRCGKYSSCWPFGSPRRRPTLARSSGSRDILREARESIRLGDTSTFSDLDLEFHRVIWTSTNNSLAVRIGELIGGQIRLLVATTARAPGRFRGAFEEHSEIYRAIRMRRPQGRGYCDAKAHPQCRNGARRVRARKSAARKTARRQADAGSSHRTE